MHAQKLVHISLGKLSSKNGKLESYSLKITTTENE
jgi:hypothetical protein